LQPAFDTHDRRRNIQLPPFSSIASLPQLSLPLRPLPTYNLKRKIQEKEETEEIEMAHIQTDETKTNPFHETGQTDVKVVAEVHEDTEKDLMLSETNPFRNDVLKEETNTQTNTQTDTETDKVCVAERAEEDKIETAATMTTTTTTTTETTVDEKIEPPENATSSAAENRPTKPFDKIRNFFTK